MFWSDKPRLKTCATAFFSAVLSREGKGKNDLENIRVCCMAAEPNANGCRQALHE